MDYRNQLYAEPRGNAWYIFDCESGNHVATVSNLGPMFGNRLAFEWHAANLWGMRIDDAAYLIREAAHANADPMGDMMGRNE